MTSTQPIGVAIVGPELAPSLTQFAERLPLQYNDFASIALLQPEEPRVWVALDSGSVVAAAIDDGLAMSVAGDTRGLAALAREIPDLDAKLVIAGRSGELGMFVQSLRSDRRVRREHFMSIAADELRCAPEAIPLRVAEESDLPMLIEARLAALEEEYGIAVPADGQLASELRSAVTRAVQVRGVAIWIEHGAVAFTAQLIAKTPEAAMFGDLYTDPALRGSGRATRALTAFCSWLLTESQHVTLRVGHDNEPAVRLYQRTGFTVLDAFESSLRADA